MKKLLCLALALILTLAPISPAHAAGAETLPPSEESEAAQWEAQRDAWLAAHPEEAAAFDPDAYFDFVTGGEYSKSDFMRSYQITEEEFRSAMVDAWVSVELGLEAMRAEVDQYEAEHPGALDGFDADRWLARQYDYYEDREEYMWYHDLTRVEDFQLAMRADYVRTLQERENQRARIAYEESQSGAFTSFDADGWLKENYSWLTKEEYMSAYGLDTEEEFRAALFLEFLDQQEAQAARVEELAAYAAQHPGVLESLDPIAYLASHYGYRDPKTAFMEDYGLETEEEFLHYLQYEYMTLLQQREARRAAVADYEAEHPGFTAEFDAAAYFAEEYSYLELELEEFMEYCELETEEDFRNFLMCQWIEEQAYSLQARPDVADDEKARLGGDPGGLGVMVNGSYLSFGEGKPYAQSGVIYVPAETLAEALGQEPRTVTADGYAPLRASAAEAGYAVYWDALFDTAVLLDLSAEAEALDQSFATLNGALDRWRPASSQSLRLTCDANMDLTLFDSIEGDQTYAASANLEGLAAPQGMELTGSYDLTAFRSILADQLGEAGYAELVDESGPELQAVLGLFGAGGFQIRSDYASGAAALTADFLPSVFSIAGRPYSKDIWLTWEDVPAVPGTYPTMGGMLVSACLSASEREGLSPVYYHGRLAEAGRLWTSLLGDGQFQKEGDRQVLQLEGEKLIPLFSLLNLRSGYSAYETSSFQELRLSLSVGPDGGLTGSYVIHPQSAIPLLDARAEGTWTLAGGTWRSELTFHLKNVYQLRLTAEGELRPTADQPQTTPPDGAVLLPMESINE